MPYVFQTLKSRATAFQGQPYVRDGRLGGLRHRRNHLCWTRARRTSSTREANGSYGVSPITIPASSRWRSGGDVDEFTPAWTASTDDRVPLTRLLAPQSRRPLSARRALPSGPAAAASDPRIATPSAVGIRPLAPVERLATAEAGSIHVHCLIVPWPASKAWTRLGGAGTVDHGRG